MLTHGEECEVWHVDTVVEEHGTGPLRPEVSTLKCCFLKDQFHKGLKALNMLTKFGMIMATNNNGLELHAESKSFRFKKNTYIVSSF